MREATIVNEWKQEGAIEELRLTLRDLLQDRFGTLPQELAARIEVVSDPAPLRQAIRRVAKLARLEDLSL
jgi:hypothetical protein